MRKLLLASLAALGLSALAYAQIIVPNSLSGNECWNAGQGPGGPSTGFVCSSIRNTAGMSVITGTGAATTLATQQIGTYMWHSTAPTTWAVTTPVTPFDGEILTLGTDTTLTTLVTLTANTGQTLSSTFTSQTLTAATSIAYQYNLASAVWYRVR